MTPQPLVALNGVSKRFGPAPSIAGRVARRLRRSDAPKSVVHAVSNVDLHIYPGDVVGIVGESGCGKSTLGRMAAGIMQPSDGDVLFGGQRMADMNRSDARRAQLSIQMIFQDPYASLNPRMRAAEIIGEAPRFHGLIGPAGFDDYVCRQMQRAGIDPSYRSRFPHQFSGGQRQRVGIARALAVRPDMLVCDEAVAALDVSIQAQIINLFMDLRETLNLTYLFISHDLGLVEHLSDRVAIMYLGRIVEQAPTEDIFGRANHPYTQALLAEVPRVELGRRRYSPIQGELPSPMAPPPGCHFHPRCPHAMPRCYEESPALKIVAPGHLSACHLNDMA